MVERTLAWLNRNRRLAKDFEATIESAKAWLMIASVKLMIRRLARQWSTYWMMSRALSGLGIRTDHSRSPLHDRQLYDSMREIFEY